MIDHLLSCRCGEVIVKSMNGTTKVRSKILIFRDGAAYAVCKGCGEERQVPVELSSDSIIQKGGRPQLFISKDKKLEVQIPPKRR